MEPGALQGLFHLRGSTGSKVGVARDVCLARTFLSEWECKNRGLVVRLCLDMMWGFLCYKNFSS